MVSLACLDHSQYYVPKRDKNHASVIIWSWVMNHMLVKILLTWLDYFRSVDNTRPVHYEGVTWCREFDCHYTRHRKSWCMRNQLDTEEYLTNNPPKTLYSCEYMHTMGKFWWWIETLH